MQKTGTFEPFPQLKRGARKPKEREWSRGNTGTSAEKILGSRKPSSGCWASDWEENGTLYRIG